ncbi:MAG: glutamyl-tRNA(Gln) and/or aspartyl-tRNA(Asn) amidotransferase, B subunit, partial [Candidatus Berkelbacteria bacterium Licking1014_96]
ASDYRYFPEPDIPPIKTTNLIKIKKEIPELPEERRKRYLDLGLGAKAIETIVAKKSFSDYFDEAVRAGGEAHKIYDLMINEKCGTKIKSEKLVESIKLVMSGEVSNKILKEILPRMIKSGESAKKIIKDQGLSQISDEDKLKVIISKIIRANPQAVESYRGGKAETLGFLVGQVMKETRGQANPALTNKLLTEMLK